VIVGAEEIDWPTLDSFKLFSPGVICSEGAGAIYVSSRATESAVEVVAITEPHFYSDKKGKVQATKSVRAELMQKSADTVLCDSRAGVSNYDVPDTATWNDWTGPRLSPKTLLGEGMMASAGWQCVAAVDAIRQGAAKSAVVSISGCLQQAVGASFARNT
jgi:hypothetical protein